jgi:5-methylcytosine-specific restriction endonuclease McrA
MPRYDWNAVQKFHDGGYSREQCMLRFGFSAAAWSNAKKRGTLHQKRRAYKPVEIAAFHDRARVKRLLFIQKLLRDSCYECGITHWLGQPLSLHLDHINGVANDHRIENLRILCPNCHSQTETFAGRNVRRVRGSQA